LRSVVDQANLAEILGALQEAQACRIGLRRRGVIRQREKCAADTEGARTGRLNLKSRKISSSVSAEAGWATNISRASKGTE
jgi:hypothetical protein